MRVFEKLNDCLILFKDYLFSERNLSENTISAYFSDLGQFTEYFMSITEDSEYNEKKGLDGIFEIEHVDSYIIWLSQKMFENTSIHRKISSIAVYFKFLKLEHLIEQNPAIFLIRPKLGVKLPIYLTVDEVERLLDTFSKESIYGVRDFALYELMYSAGLRVSEIVALNIEDIFWDERLVKVCGKGDKERFVPIGDRAIGALDNYINTARVALECRIKKRSNVLFLNYRGQRLTRKGIWKNIKEARIKAGIEKEVKVHTLRHSFATHLVQNGADIRYVQSFLGHKCINTTEIYTHLDMRHVKKSYERGMEK